MKSVRLTQEQRYALAGRTVGGVSFMETLGFAPVGEGTEECPFCGASSLAHYPEYGVGGHVENLQSHCGSCEFFQSYWDGKVDVPKAWYDEHIVTKP